ncbi:hypothetical protein NEF87_000581 [Candidatus Lokiarchaeum ossiferum]|uniref:Uncharacterized protein n=1 Tax=Candidatus Lokiarchaeum ossiferum TaxID=2951803 RepID=A0ABY6HP40_9ARCH|nr:hypothetical protein NEF87_000581 [Candidatus Lokiarchaeum sp. B-35]
MPVSKEKFPKYAIPLFNSWVALCNFALIIIASIWYATNPSKLGNNPELAFGLTIGINILSLLMLVPFLKLDEIPRFIIGAIIWYIIVSIVYIILGLYIFVIFGTIQLIADIWLDFKIMKVGSNS